ncbi:hypothetical protein CTZ27_00745 [Streptomyces griseocarneus]|nr:hypothetical protein CTZ27_00745 [Streptomyces griseocarneus]
MASPVPYASTSLADLLPGLRYADPQLLAARLEDVRLPLGWWHATPLMAVEQVIGSEALSHLVAQTLRAVWPHAELGDVIPVLRLLDEETAATAGQTVAGAARQAGPTVADGDEALGGLFGEILDRLHQRGIRRETGSGVQEAVEVIAAWLPEEAPAEVRAALDLLQGLAQASGAAPRENRAGAGRGEPVAAPQADAEGEASIAGPVAEDGDEGRHPDQYGTAGDVEVLADGAEPPAALMDGPLAAFSRFVGTWDERDTVIAGQRMFAARPEKLSVLGERFSVSRERVRQVERIILGAIRQWLAGHGDEGVAGRAFAGHLAAVADRFGAVCTLGEVHVLHPDHTCVVEALGVPLGDVVARLLPGRTVDGKWIIQGDAAALRSVMQEELLAACGDAPLDRDEAAELGARFGVRAEVLGAWAAEVGRFREIEGKLVHWGRSVNDRAVAVLALHGAPLPMEDIHERLADGTAINSMRNQIWVDERFIRLDRNLYGLRQWGGEEYLGIREMIGREIECAGGEVEINTLVEALTTRFDVSAASVRTNLAAPVFARSRRGWVCLADQNGSDPAAPYVPRNDVAGTRRCFLGADGRWWYRLEVNAEHLRGSGTPVPAGWAAHIGGAPLREPITFRHDAGETTLQWRNQSVLGSVRPLLEHIGSGIGDHVFFNVTDGRMAALRLPAPQPGTGVETRAARLTGWTAAVNPREAVEVIARRIGMDPGVGSAALLERLGERGDRDIAELVEQALTGGAPAF